jgi:glycosyltransferase involved in cell wall biosynthesis
MGECVMSEPLVSIIIPTYNRADVVSMAIESVLGQTYRNIEVIVVDDGSTDRTCQVLNRYRDQIRVLTEENQGPSRARNKGITAAHGQLIAFLDSDDAWLPTKVERQVACLQRTGKSVPCCLCNATLRQRNGTECLSFDEALLAPPYEEGFWLNPAEIISSRFIFFTQAAVVRRQALEKVGGFDEELWVMEDYDLALRLSLLGPWTFIKEPLVIYHSRTQQSLTNQAECNPIRLQQCIASIYIRALSLNWCEYPMVRAHLRRNLRFTGLRLRIAQLSRKQSVCALAISDVLQFADRVANAIYRRSPWFPKMEVMPLSIK